MRFAQSLASGTAAAALIGTMLWMGSGDTAKTKPGEAVPPPAVDAVRAAKKGKEVAVVAGGCFWGVQLVFEHVRGVISATAGYSGGSRANPTYVEVSSGATGHAESVKIVFDPSQITYGEILRVFFSVTHDPTQRNRQGPDEGTQYRSALFPANEEQLRISTAYIAQLDAAKVFTGKIVTEVKPLVAFYPAENYHQDYSARHPDDPYISINDRPKVENLKKEFPELWKEK